jgi:NADH-quinone oxidoreductase subunit J
MIEAVLFYLLAGVLVVTGLLVITRTNPIASALAMVGGFAALAGLYALLSAPLLAVVQVLVYAGGIMVLMIFVIMLLNLHPGDLEPLRARPGRVVPALIGALGVFLGPLLFVVVPSWRFLPGTPVSGFGDIFSVGRKLFGGYLFPFEMLSLVLLTAVVGALVLAKKKL